MNLIWNPTARNDLKAIVAFVGKQNPAAAQRLGDAIEACAERLPAHPFMYRPGRIAGTREAVAHPNYLLIYEVHVEGVEIMRVIHSRREYP
jgi:addiction module RelE/StbE family toxin